MRLNQISPFPRSETSSDEMRGENLPDKWKHTRVVRRAAFQSSVFVRRYLDVIVSALEIVRRESIVAM
jgi:hypothetical protein